MHVFDGKKLNFHFLISLFSGIADIDQSVPDTCRTKEIIEKTQGRMSILEALHMVPPVCVRVGGGAGLR